VEACEAYESFLDLRPEIALITNMEAEHLDHHGTEAHLRASFRAFLQRLLPGGCAVLCADRPELRAMGADLDCDVITYGTRAEASVRATEVAAEGYGMTCNLWLDGEPAGALRLGVPGAHNLLNALGALAAARRAGAPLAACQSAMAAFRGVDRRFQIVGETGGVLVIDDYAHHPTEIAATINTARAAFPGRRLIAVFQPHLYSRTRDFAERFAQALEEADLSVLTDIYPAREAPLPGVTVNLISEPLRARRGEDVVLEMAKGEMATKLASLVQTGDVILAMGAGDIGQAARELVRRLGGEPTGRPEVAAKE
jgi:UDP-N-acetylmuramate--alanine ligase